MMAGAFGVSLAPTAGAEGGAATGVEALGGASQDSSASAATLAGAALAPHTHT